MKLLLIILLSLLAIFLLMSLIGWIIDNFDNSLPVDRDLEDFKRIEENKETIKKKE